MTVAEAILSVVAAAAALALLAGAGLRGRAGLVRRRSPDRHGNPQDHLLDVLPVGLYRATAQFPGRLLRANRAMAELLGYEDVEALLARPVASLYEDPAERVRLLAELRLRGQVRSRLLRLVKADGKALWAEVSLAMSSPENAESAYDGVIMDVTPRIEAQHSLQRSEREYRDLVERTETGYVLLASDGRVIQANTAFAHMLGQAGPDDLVGCTINQWIAPESAGAMRQALSRSNGPGSQEVAYLRPDGTRMYVLMSLVHESADSGVVKALCRDVSRLKWTEMELRKTRDIARVGAADPAAQRPARGLANRIAERHPGPGPERTWPAVGRA